MAEDTPTAPAGGSDQPLTESAAATLLQDFNFDEEAPKEEKRAPQIDSARKQENDTEEAVERLAADIDKSGSEDDTTDAEETGDEAFVHGNARTRLRDGTSVSVAELKKSFDEAKEFRRRESEFTANARQVEARAAQTAQQEQLFAATISQAIAALQQAIPPEPDPALLEADPIDYFQKKEKRDSKLAEINRLQAAQNYSAQQSRAEQAQQFQGRLKAEQAQLYERAPELVDETKRREFYADMISIGKTYGFSEEEMNNVHDHKVMLMVKDAIAYRKLQADKPKAMEKAKNAVPVQKPSARVTSNERSSQKLKSTFERARKTRSIDDVGAVLAEFD